MKLLYVFAAILAFSLADEDKSDIEDLEAAASSVELMKEGADLKAEASAYSYVPPSQRPPQWNVPYAPPQNSWNPPNEPVPQTQPAYPPVQPSYPPVQPSYPPVHPTYPPVQQTWNPPHYHPSTTTTPVPVIKNEQYYGDNGSYKYEYQIADGTHVGEEGYFTDPKGTDESLVKRGWYSYVGGDGKTYTVTWWADRTGFHAFGDHLPTPPPVPAAIQAALDKEKEVTPAPTVSPTPVYYPTPYPTQHPVYPQPTYPSQPVYNPPQQTYYPPQQNYPQQPSYGK